MNIPSIIIILLLALAIGVAIRQVRRGGTCNCRGCDACRSGCPNCAKRR